MSIPASAPTRAPMPLSRPAWWSITLPSVAPEVAVGREVQVLADLAVGGVEHRGLDGAHRGDAGPHVDDRRGAAPDDGRARVRPAGG